MRLAVLGLIVSALLAAPVGADARTYCVGTSGAGCAQHFSATGDQLQAAIAAAYNDIDLDNPTDTVRVGPGIFARSNGMGFETEGDSVTIEGSGPGTVLTTTGSAGNPHVLASSPGVSTAVRKLTVRAQTGRTVSGIFGFLSVSDVRFDGGALGTALDMRAGGSVTRVVMDTATLFRGIDTDDGAVGYAIKIEDVLIRLNRPPLPTNNAVALSFRAQGASAQATVRHVTVIGDGSSGTAGLSAVASRSADNTTAGTLAVRVRDSLLRGVQTPLSRLGSNTPCSPCGSSNVEYRYSSLAMNQSYSGGAGALTAGPGNLPNPDPVLSPAFVPLSGSPLIDAGDPAGPEAGDSALDAAGGPRIVSGRRDIGALEHAPPPARSPDGDATPPNSSGGDATPPGGSVTAADTTPPSLSRLRLTTRRFRVGRRQTAVNAAWPSRGPKRKRAARGTTVRFDSTEAATVRLAFEQRLRGRRVKRRSKVVCVKRRAGAKHTGRACTLFRPRGTLIRRAAGGPNAIAFTGRIGSRALPIGRYRLIVTAIDAAGNATRSRPTAFRVVR